MLHSFPTRRSSDLNNIANLNKPENESCIARIKVETLKKEGMFEEIGRAHV